MNLLTFRSAYFEIKAVVRVGNVRRIYYGIVDFARNPAEPVLLHLRWEEPSSESASAIESAVASAMTGRWTDCRPAFG